MQSTKMRTSIAALAAMLIIVGASSAVAENLGEMLRESGWDRILGTWVDEDTNGDTIKITYAWRFEDRVVEVTSKTGKLETVGLVGVNAKTGEVHHLGADNQGGGSLGKWRLEDGDAVLELGFVSGEGREGAMKIRLHLKDDDTLVLTVEAPEPITRTLIRAKE
jgi:hypothetical protein